MDDVNRARDGVSPITPRTPPRQLFLDSLTAPSRPSVTEQRLMVDVVSSSVESPLDQSRNNFILLSPREIASRFVLRLSPPHIHESDSTVAPQSAFEAAAVNGRQSDLSEAHLVSPRETQLIGSARNENDAHNISIDNSECAFVPIQDADDASFDEPSDTEELPMRRVGLKSRKTPGEFSGDDWAWYKKKG